MSEPDSDSDYKPRIAVVDLNMYMDGDDFVGKIAVYEKLWVRMMPLTLQSIHLRAIADKLDELNGEGSK